MGADAIRGLHEPKENEPPLVVSEGPGSSVVVANGLAQSREELVTVRVARPDVLVKDAATGAVLPSQINAVSAEEGDAAFDLVFKSGVPALGETRYIVETCLTTKSTDPPYAVPGPDCATQASVSTKVEQSSFRVGQWRVSIDPHDSSFKLFALKRSGSDEEEETLMNVNNLNWVQYDSPHDDVYRFDGQSDASPLPSEWSKVTAMRVQKGPLMTVADVSLAGGALMRFSLVEPGRLLQLELDVPAPSELGRDTVLRFQSDLQTDRGANYAVNGYQSDRASFDDTRPAGENYYPLCTRAWLKEEEDGAATGRALAVHTESPVGFMSGSVGRIELMLHRRTRSQVSGNVPRGNDTKRARHKLHLLPVGAGKGDHGIEHKSALVDRLIQNPLRVLVASYKQTSGLNSQEEALASQKRTTSKNSFNDLPREVGLLAFRSVRNGFWQLQLENLLATNEGGKNVSVELDRFLSTAGINPRWVVKEMSITFGYSAAEARQRRMWGKEGKQGEAAAGSVAACLPQDGNGLKVVLAPKEICSILLRAPAHLDSFGKATQAF